MTQNPFTIIYHISQIPDPAYSQYQAIAGSDIRSAVADGFEHLLRTLAQMPPQTVSAELLFVFAPQSDGSDRQSRLKLFLRLSAGEPGTLDSVDRLVKGGLLSRFYEFEDVNGLPLTPKRLGSACRLIRREEFVQPLHDSHFNYKIPSCYYTIMPFEPNVKNDYLLLDKVLDRLDEQVIIRIKVRPEDVSAQLHAHTGYLADLQSINRNWDDEYDDSDCLDYLESGSYSYRHVRNTAKPFQRRDPLADDILRQQRRLHESLRQSHLCFSIQVLTEKPSTARLIGSVLAESAFEQGDYRLILDENTDAEGDVLKAPVSNMADLYQPGFSVTMDVEDYHDLRALSHLATVDELLGLFTLPVGSFCSPFCLRKNTDPESIPKEELIVLGHDEHSLAGNDAPVARGIHMETLKKHFSVFGLPGAGKTTSNINILGQLSDRGIPFMVIESAKKEYRVLKKFKKHKNATFRKLARALEVYTPGAEKVSPFRFNPLELLPGIDEAEHIENLLSCFKASIPVSSGSLPALLGEALERVYEEFSDRNKPPVISDLVAKVEDVLASKGYSAQTRLDMQTVIEVRLGVLSQRIIGKVFQCRNSVSLEHLMQVPSVIELDRLATEQSCLLTLFILNAIGEKLRASPPKTKGLRYVVVIEEAHNLVGSSRGGPASEDVADPKSFTAELIAKMLVELRALGVGIILSDQHPSALDTGASKSVGSKLAFRQVYSDDREELGRSMLFGDIEMQDISRLQPGEAFFFTEGYFGPRRIRTVNLHQELNLSELPSDRQLCEIIKKEKWFKDAAAMRILVELVQYNEQMNKYDDYRITVSNSTEKLLAILNSPAVQHSTRSGSSAVQTILSKLRTQRNELTSVYARFARGPHRRFLYLKNQIASGDRTGNIILMRFEKSLTPCTDNVLESIGKSIKKCINLKNRR